MSTPRKRIVIDLNSLPIAGNSITTRRRKRWPKVLALLVVGLLAILLIIGAGGYFWWNHYQTTPTYSVALVVDAAQRNDMAAFDHLVDTDKVVAGLASQITEKVVASPLGLVGGAAIRSQVEALMPTILPKLEQNFREQLAAEMKEFSSGTSPKPFILLALTLPALVKVTTENNTARAAMTLHGETVELTMQRDGGVWKVVGLKDDALVGRIMDDVVKSLPVMGKIDAVEPRKSIKRRSR
jgi:hypothetical protein